jgi:hypothetical protein
MNHYLEELEKVLNESVPDIKKARSLLADFKRETRPMDNLCRKPVQDTDCYLKRGHTGACLPFPKPPASITPHEDSPRGMWMNVCPKVNDKKRRCIHVRGHSGECEFT